jgi:hypothetical protein
MRTNVDRGIFTIADVLTQDVCQEYKFTTPRAAVTDLRRVCQSGSTATACTPNGAYDHAVIIEGEVTCTPMRSTKIRRMPGTDG